MRLDPDHFLSEAASEALDALQWTEPEAGLDSQRIPDKVLMGLVFGSLPEDDREQIARSALRSPSSRRRLVGLHREMETLLRSPVEQWSGPARTAFYLEPARHLLESVRALSASKWDSIARSNEPRFVTMRAVLARISRHMQVALSAPRMAAARGGPTGTVPYLFADVAADGALEAVARPEGPPQEGRLAVLELVDPLGGRFPIATAFLRNGHWNFRVVEFGQMMALPEGPLPNSLFRVTVEAEIPEPQEPSSLWAEDEEGGLFAIALAGPANISAGVLTLTILVSPTMREVYASHRLIVSIPLGRHNLILGSWPTSEMADIATLQAHVFDLPEGDLPLGSILRIRLVDEKNV